jgi:hypothetical protein
VRDVLIFVSEKWKLAGVRLLHLVKVIVEPAVACNDVDCSSIVSSLCLVSSVEVTDDFGLLVAKNHLEVFGSIMFPFFLIKLGNFVVNLFLDIRVWYGAVEDDVA